MLKLSEIPNETMLCLDDGDYSANVIAKGNLLDNAYLLDDKINITIAIPYTASFDWESVIERESEEMYEDWDEDITRDISDSEWDILNKAKELINEIFKKRPTYESGKKVVNDLITSTPPERNDED